MESAQQRDGRPVFSHAAVSKFRGPTQTEIDATVHRAKPSAGWSIHAGGLQLGPNQFKKEVLAARDPVCAWQRRR